MAVEVGLSAEALAQWARRTRMAVLVPAVDEGADLMLHVLAINTGLWGGSGDITVPCHLVTGDVDEGVVELACRFDPDVWGTSTTHFELSNSPTTRRAR